MSRTETKLTVITIGDELVSGSKRDIIGHTIAREATRAGLSLREIKCLPDDEIEITENLRAAIDAGKVVICSGGLGGTDDDITVPVAAHALERSVVRDEAVESIIRERFATAKKEVPKTALRMADVIEGSRVILPRKGLAPGQLIECGEKTIILLPGFPQEALDIYRTNVLPLLAEKYELFPKSVRSARLALVPEAVLAERLSGEFSAINSLKVSYIPDYGELEVVFSAPFDCQETVDRAMAYLNNSFSNNVYSYERESLEEVVVKLLRDKGYTFSTAESVTGGLVSQRVTSVSGSSFVFSGSVICYMTETKKTVLGIDSEAIENHGIVSKETAAAMAREARKLFATDIAASTTGYAGPSGGDARAPIGRICISIDCSEATLVSEYDFSSTREVARRLSSTAVLESVRKMVRYGIESLERSGFERVPN